MMVNIPSRGAFLVVVWTILSIFASVAESGYYSPCAQTINSTWHNDPNSTSLRDQQGKPTDDILDAWGISYYDCKKHCSSDANSGIYDWDYLSQGVSSWFLPYLAFTAQLPYETRDNTTNFLALLLAVGSPSLIAYSLALTILNARWINRVFRQIGESSRALHRPRQLDAIKAARSILIETQHVPIRIWNGPRREIAQLIARPENFAWWCRLQKGILKTKRRWTYSLYAQVSWVCVVQLLSVVDFFRTMGIDHGSSIGMGIAINSLWLWMIPVILGWVYVGEQTSAGSVKNALTEAIVPVLGSERNLSGDCIGIRDRTSFDENSTQSRKSSAARDHRDDENPPEGGNNVEPNATVVVTDSGLVQAQTSSNEQKQSETLLSQPDLMPDNPKVPYTGAQAHILEREVSADRPLSMISTLQPTEAQFEPLLDPEGFPSSLSRTFVGFSLAGDDEEPGPIFNYARIWGQMNAAKHIAQAFFTCTERQLRRQPVGRGREWNPDPEKWDQNLKGTPEEYSRYINPRQRDIADYTVHTPASADMIINCIIAAFVAVFLQWGTTGAALLIAFKTPVVGLGCQSGSYLIYGLVSTISWLLLTLAAYLSHRYSLQLETSRRRPSPLLAPSAILIRLLGKTLAVANAFFIIATCVLQFTGLYDNCWCDACIPSLGKKAGWVIVFASDSQIAAVGKNAWIGGVFLGLAVGAVASIWVFMARGDEIFEGSEQ